MSVQDTIRLRLRSNEPLETTEFGLQHYVIKGSFDHPLMATKLPEDCVDIFVFDPPGLDDDCEPSELRQFMRDIIRFMDVYGKQDCAVAIPFRDRKGSRFLKSTICAAEMADHGLLSGWKLFRQFIWLTGEADFHRSRGAFAPVFVWRRGNMPTNDDAELRYKDIIRLKDNPDSGSVWSIPVELTRKLLQLFTASVGRQKFTVCDPFAGSGSTMFAAELEGHNSISIELNPGRADALIRLVHVHGE